MSKTVPSLETLRKRSARVLRLPGRAQALIAHYLAIEVSGARTNCPYHLNPGLRSRNRALVGKGRPEEIEAAATSIFARFNTTISEGQSDKLRSSLRDYGLGIDCSGFVAWVLDALTEHHLKKPIWRCLRFPNARRHAVSRFRPLENISARLLTNERNATRISDLHDVRPGDMIRALHGGHVIVVTEVGLDKHVRAQYFRYAHSTTGNKNVSGVSEGMVLLTASDSLSEQTWVEGDDSTAPAYLAVQAGEDDSRLVRLKALDKVVLSAKS